jgi:hypothetical protein
MSSTTSDEKADAYLDKPFTKRILLDTVERLVKKI